MIESFKAEYSFLSNFYEAPVIYAGRCFRNSESAYRRAAITSVVFLTGALLGFGYIGFGNTANGFEVDIKATYTNNQNVYDNGFKKVMEQAQVPQMQVDGLKTLYDGTMKNRYGADGSKAMLQFIKEQNPDLNQATYLKIQQTIESFHNEFQANQTSLISKKQEYERFLQATTSGRLYNTIGGYGDSFSEEDTVLVLAYRRLSEG